MAALSSSLIRFSYRHPFVLSPTIKLSLRPHLSPPQAAPPDSSSTSGDSSPPPSPETKTNDSPPSYLDQLNYYSKTNQKKEKKKKKKDKTVIRREPIQVSARKAREETKEEEEEISKNESAFLLAWLALGVLILVEGVALAASGFLPDEWDSFFVKYLYPSFTPTVFLFVGGSVAYGVIKYLEAEKMK